jgi:uncharacterized protein (TIGR04255 family)
MHDSNLPSFDKPPLVEVALSVQFEPLSKLSSPYIGLLWSKFRNRFPKIEEVQPVRPVIERLGVPQAPRPQLQLSEASETPRIWFVDESDRELIQIQNNRFIRNWKKTDPFNKHKYPRYESYIRPKFQEDLTEFCRFLSDEALGELKPNQCEITYINHILAGQGWHQHSDFGLVFRIWDEKFNQGLGLEIENIDLGFKTLLRDQNGEFIGRLHIIIKPGFHRNGNVPLFSLELTARGRPFQENIEGILAFLDFGRSYIVKTFESITTQKMHEIWGKVHV